MPSLYVHPVSVSITPEQLRWLDERRRHGSLSRSAVLRQVLDGQMRQEHADQESASGGAVSARAGATSSR